MQPEKWENLEVNKRKKQVGVRHVKHILAQIQQILGDPLEKSRPLKERFIGNCRTFSVLLTSYLRYQGIPVRPRCGFGRYFKPDWFEDHWVCEYWNQEQARWILVDAQLDEFQCRLLKIRFDPLDVPRGQFIVAGKAWDRCRKGESDPERFGIFDMHGLWFIRGNLVRDVAALNKAPLLPWDGWGLIDREQESLIKEELGLLDQLAQQTFDEVDYPEIREAYETRGGLAVPPIIKSYTQSGTLEIELATEKVLK